MRYLFDQHEKVQRFLGNRDGLHRDENMTDIRKTRWIAPTVNPVGSSFGSEAIPDLFYLDGVWVFLWDPQLQYPRYMPQKTCCPKCKSKNTKCDGGWGFRPYHWWDKIVYIYHRHEKCEDCGARYPTIRSDYLAQLPTIVAEQFPFVHPTERGPGLYWPMLSLLIELIPNGILFGKFAKAMNAIKRSNFAQSHIAYLDTAFHWLNVQGSATAIDSSVPVVFSPFNDQSGYCGIELTPSLLRLCLRARMNSVSSYMQVSSHL